jgi:MarR family 2-MHQ and catechol resistance regulon transcriptional repressor
MSGLASAPPANYLSSEMTTSTNTASRAAARPARTAPPVASGVEDDLKLLVVLARAYASVTRHTEADVARHGLTIAEFGVLEALYHKGPLLLGEVQRRILVSSGGITFLVDRLQKKGLVERRTCKEDRRARYAALTKQGEALIRRIFPEHARCISHAVSGLTKAERQTAIKLLRTMGRAAAEMGSGSGTE